MLLTEELTKTLEKWSKEPPSRVWVGYSGGLDSQTLLYALHQLSPKFPWLKLTAIHVNHALSAFAEDWELHCKQFCSNLNIPLRIVKIPDPSSTGRSLEEAARHARYQVFAELVQTEEYLLTAHHQDDQAETLLLQVLRGAGVRGLAAMPTMTRFAAGYLCRPLLHISRAAILQYATEQQLHWVEDDSNNNLRFSRNLLRHQVFPILQQHWPAANQMLARSAQHSAEASELLAELAKLDLQQVQGKAVDTLSAHALKNFPLSRQKNILRYWIAANGYLLPSSAKILQICQSVINSRYDAMPCVSWSGSQIRRYGDAIYLMHPIPKSNIGKSYEWSINKPLLIESIGTLSARHETGKGIKLTTNVVTVKFRQGGEVCQLLGRQGTHSLKKLMQEWRIPPWQRDQIPLIYVGNELAMIVGWRISTKFAVNENEQGVVINLQL